MPKLTYWVLPIADTYDMDALDDADVTTIRAKTKKEVMEQYHAKLAKGFEKSEFDMHRLKKIEIEYDNVLDLLSKGLRYGAVWELSKRGSELIIDMIDQYEDRSE